MDRPALGGAALFLGLAGATLGVALSLPGSGRASTGADGTGAGVEAARAEYLVRGCESVAARPPALRSATVVRIGRRPRSDIGPCVVDVEFRGGEVPCALRAVLGPGQRHTFCSRAVNHPLVGCRTSCSAGDDPGGARQVHVSAACSDVDVAAQVVYTRGAEDLEWEGVSDLHVESVSRPRSSGGGR